MKEKLLEIAFRYLILNVAFLPVILVLRGFELYYLAHAVAIQEKPFAMLATGLIYDFRAFLVFALLMFFPFLLLSLINRRTGSLVYLVILGLLALLQFTLIRYFAINLVPLDDVLFRYSFSDVRMIIHNSDKLDFWTFLPMILLLFLLGILQWLAGRITMIPRVFTLLLSCYLVALFLSLLSPPALKAYGSDIVYYFKVNKSFYFIQESLSYFFREKPAGTTDDIAGEIKRYQGLHKEFDFTSTYYPLIHKEETDDVLGPLFNLKKQPPNLVFIIMESLSSALVGDQSWFGNFTPFLDSLKDQSLYWDNFLSVSERTFHVFASLFASLPYGKGEFQKDLSQIPFHYSLIRYLRENGYYTGFYYGGYAAFTNYDQFLKKQGIHFIMEDFGPAYQDKKKLYPDFYWGYHDEFTFARSLDVIDSLNKEPRLDIYLTLSTHHPFHPPDAERFLRKYEEITTRQGHPAEKKGRTDPNRKIFSSVLYTDDALRNFLKEYQKRDDFNNTIFFITGDHFFMELSYSDISAIERYHVPMIIYSPMLKNPRHFRSVSSHLDITPSLIAMLQTRYHFPGHPFVHWLGKGLDTVTEFRNTHTIQFVTSSKKLVDYLEGDSYLSIDRLYKIEPGLRTGSVNNPVKLGQLQENLRTTTAVYQYAARNNKMILPELFMQVKFDTTLIYANDSTGYSFGDTPNLFINLIRPFQFDTGYRLLEYVLDFNYVFPDYSDTSKVPRLVISVENSTSENVLYHQIPFPGYPSHSIKPGEWTSYHSKEVLDVSSIEDLSGLFLKVYFFNNRLSHIRCDSLQFRLNGID